MEMEEPESVIACDKRKAFAQGSEATKQSSFAAVKPDCFAALAMTIIKPARARR
jgi:hypothetical protein